MSAFRTILAACLIALGGTALADQSDPRLGELFDQLKDAPTQADAAPVEQQIWSIWLEVPDVAAELLMANGIRAMARHDYPAALAEFDRVVEIVPDYAEGWNRRATAHYLASNYDESLNDIARTLELEPRHFGALSGRGMVYVQLDDLPQALASFEEALAINPYLRGADANAQAIRKILKQREI